MPSPSVIAQKGGNDYEIRVSLFPKRENDEEFLLPFFPTDGNPNPVWHLTNSDVKLAASSYRGAAFSSGTRKSFASRCAEHNSRGKSK